MTFERLTPRNALAAAALLSALALAAAYTAQYAFGLEPCVLCLYQRAPFAVVILLGLAGFFVPRTVKPTLALSAAAFFANGAIALYHTGVERHWWESALEGCRVSFEDAENLLENILNAQAARCDEIPWADPLFGLSMANYNVLLCCLLGVLCLAALFRQPRAYS